MSGKNNREFDKFAGADSKRDSNKPDIDAPLLTDLFPMMNPFYGTMKQESHDKFMESNKPLSNTNIKIDPHCVVVAESSKRLIDGLVPMLTLKLLKERKMESEKNNQLSEDI